ncbi:ABC transporter substrate-binding protein [Teredinibacter purpureus]|uniref:ABC transporter substrate-binding protein n=1 Tax=Teredinibacter purpureus TaxID=2731756 RepID=UPI0005F7CEEA|nr:ABC transporter substrate-binding protein [Teredinibacter purpureus]
MPTLKPAQYFWLVAMIVLIAVYAAALVEYPLLFSTKTPVNIAVVGPMTVKGAEGDAEGMQKGRIMRQSVLLYQNTYNANLIEGQRPIKINVYDDQNNDNPSFLRSIIQNKIVAEDNIAVIGHRSSDVSTPAAKIYQEFEIPVVGGSATGPDITENNPWSFRVVPDNKAQGKSIARYIENSALFSFPLKIAVVQTRDPYGASMMDAFRNEIERQTEKSNKIDLSVFDIAVGDSFSMDDAYQFAQHLQQSNDESKRPSYQIIFLATHDNEGKKIIRALREEKTTENMIIIGGASIGKRVFSQHFKNLPREQEQPGFYTKNLYALSPIVFDTAGETGLNFYSRYLKAYGEMPDSSAAAYYDAIHTVVTALNNSDLNPEDGVQAMRAKLSEALHDIRTPETSVAGLANAIFFDEHGNVVRETIQMGQFLDDSFISTPIQIDLQNNEYEIKNVVYSALEILNISRVSIADNSFTADFLLWFRGPKGIDFDNIEFINAIDRKQLDASELVARSRVSSITGLEGDAEMKVEYRRYAATRTFSLNQQRGRSNFGEYVARIDFNHATLPRQKLVYARDMENANNQALARANYGLDPEAWTVRPPVSFQSTLTKPTFGDPALLMTDTRDLKFSKFSTMAIVNKNNFSLRGIVPPNLEKMIFKFSLFGWVCVAFLLAWLPQKLYILNSVIHAFILLTLEPLLLAWATKVSHMALLLPISTLFDMLWWLLFAATLSKGINVYLWDILDKAGSVSGHAEQQRITPTIFRSLTFVICYSLAILAIIGFVFDKDLTSLLATSGLVTLILGLALQPNLVDLFAGVVLNIERPFCIGDEIEIAGGASGVVKNISWRSTFLLNTEGSLVSVPNGEIAKSTIVKRLQKDVLPTTDEVVDDELNKPA